MTTDQTISERLTAAQTWLDQHVIERPVEAAWGRTITGPGDAAAVRAALASYQNDDGGFGNGLEPDISAPQSNPFAARLALHVILETGIPTTEPTVTGLVGWLEDRQGEDGCWRWEPGTLDHPIAPWFAGWEFPALNPALDLAGILARLGLGSERLHRRCRDLYARLASPDEIANGPYYVVLPYAESLPWLIDLPGREASLDALAAHIARDVAAGNYTTPQEAAEHIGPPEARSRSSCPPGRSNGSGPMRSLRSGRTATGPARSATTGTRTRPSTAWRSLHTTHPERLTRAGPRLKCRAPRPPHVHRGCVVIPVRATMRRSSKRE